MNPCKKRKGEDPGYRGKEEKHEIADQSLMKQLE